MVVEVVRLVVVVVVVVVVEVVVVEVVVLEKIFSAAVLKCYYGITTVSSGLR